MTIEQLKAQAFDLIKEMQILDNEKAQKQQVLQQLAQQIEALEAEPKDVEPEDVR